MKEMEKIREQLEKLLEEERQAKKDEEIVRTLQVTQPAPFDAIANSMAILPFARQKIVPDACQSNLFRVLQNVYFQFIGQNPERGMG